MLRKRNAPEHGWTVGVSAAGEGPASSWTVRCDSWRKNSAPLPRRGRYKRSVPEGHTIHRLAERHRKLFAGRAVAVSSPQGRFADGAARIDGRLLLDTSAHGKHLLHQYDGDLSNT